MTVYRIELPHRGFGRSIGNMLEVLSGRAAGKVEGNWIDVEETESGVFEVVADNLTSGSNGIQDPVALGFTEWDEEVENLDHDSDEAQCFGMSNHLRWKDVDMTPDKYKAPSIDSLRDAFQHVAVCAWCPGDI